LRTELKNYQHEQYNFRLRIAAAVIFVAILFGILIVRFAYLQINEYSHYQTLAENNRISLVPIVPNRGLILDKNGVLLAQNFFVYTLEITPSKVENLEATITDISQFVEISALDRKRFNKFKAQSRDFETIPIRMHLNEVEAARFAVNHYRFPGVEI
jgi:penicillin-binding protein 2